MSLCSDWTSYSNDGAEQTGTGTDTSDDGRFDLTKGFMKPLPISDTTRLYFRPADCDYDGSFFLPVEKYGTREAFDELCVNFTAGDPKPEIRVANTYTYFNITNFA
jgi:hypothetical protein